MKKAEKIFVLIMAVLFISLIAFVAYTPRYSITVINGHEYIKSNSLHGSYVHSESCPCKEKK